ncbi:MAG: MEDS domain-containing protein [Clostridiaceae bacterium]|nr:MEDS domain-containing protein [Clostridiaceae bacterium]
MKNNLRSSGIDIIGNIPWGTHISQLYSSKTDFFAAAVPYVRSGLMNNELCIWIYSQNTSYKEIKDITGEYAEDVDIYLESGQLKVMPYTEWYIDDNGFDEARVKRQWNDLIRYALKKGYDGLRAIADTSWMEKSCFRDFSNYEHNINKHISSMPFIALCLYDAGKTDISEATEIIKNHGYVIARHESGLELIKNPGLFMEDKQLQESDNTLECDKMKTEFFSNISHEFKTPLNVILATIQLMKSQKDQAYKGMKESQYLKIMQKNCYRLLRLVNNLIDITKIDSDYYELRPQNYNIIGLIKGITGSVAEYAMKRGIYIIFDTNVEEKVIACDPDQIERIILNLLSNAIKFTHSGGSIWVKILDKGETLKISIKDTGIGIPRDKQASIFNRFQQVDKSLTRQHEGSGIGLSLVKALVEKHGGRISLNSEFGKGTEFTIEIPCNTLMDLEDKPGIYKNFSNHNYAEKISIEFSDIYS